MTVLRALSATCLVWLGLGAGSGCAGEDDRPPPARPEPTAQPDLTAASFVEAGAQRYCELMDACCRVEERQNDFTTCVETWNRHHSPSAPRFDPGMASACLDGLAALRCGQPTPKECSGALRGEPGTWACEGDSDCGPEAAGCHEIAKTCLVFTSTTIGGSCSEDGSDDCFVQGGFCAKGVCRPLPDLGEPCTDGCKVDLMCRSGKCVPAKRPGDYCTIGVDTCVVGTYCNGFTCVEELALGAKCGPNDRCAAPGFCPTDRCLDGWVACTPKPKKPVAPPP